MWLYWFDYVSVKTRLFFSGCTQVNNEFAIYVDYCHIWQLQQGEGTKTLVSDWGERQFFPLRRQEDCMTSYHWRSVSCVVLFLVEKLCFQALHHTLTKLWWHESIHVLHWDLQKALYLTQTNTHVEQVRGVRCLVSGLRSAGYQNLFPVFARHAAHWHPKDVYSRCPRFDHIFYCCWL